MAFVSHVQGSCGQYGKLWHVLCAACLYCVVATTSATHLGVYLYFFPGLAGIFFKQVVLGVIDSHHPLVPSRQARRRGDV